MNSNELDNLIKSRFIDPKGKSYAILDGIVDENIFRKEKYKILWILKEPYGDIDEYGDSCCGEDEDKRDDLNGKDESNYFRKDHKTFDPIIYISHCILNDFVLYSSHDVNYISDDPSLISTLKRIAYINISKLPGRTNSSGRESFFQETLEKCSDVIIKQIEYIKPDIIIGGNTLQYLYKYLGISENQVKAIDGFDMSYCNTSEILYINTYHPAYFMKMKTECRSDYLDAIINTAKRFKTEVRYK